MAFTVWEYKNFSKGTVQGSHNTVVTTIAVASGHGARFGASAADFPQMAAIWEISAFPDPADAFHNVPSKTEVVKITSVSSDNLTVVRAQEGTSGLDMTDTGQTFAIMGVHSADQLSQIGDGSQENVVTDHGAVGDGVADDTAAVVAAIDAAITGGTVFFPPTSGGYLLSTWAAGGKAITKNLRFLGSGPQSFLEGPVGSDFLDLQASLEMDNMAFKDWDIVINLDNHTTGTIDEVNIHNCSSDGHFSFLSWIGGVTGTPTVNTFNIQSNRMKNGTNRNLVLCAGDDTTGIIHNLTISNNEIKDGTRGIHVAGNVLALADDPNFERKRNVTITGNHVWNQTSGVTPVGIISFGNRVTITGNVVHDIHFSAGATEIWGIYTKGNWATVSGNNVYNLDEGLIAGTTAYRLKGAHRTLSGNIAKTCGAAFRLEGNANVVCGNLFEDIRVVGGETVGSDVYREGLTIDGNVFYHTPGRRYLDLGPPNTVTGGPFVEGETITQTTSGATAVVRVWNDSATFDQNLDGGGIIVVDSVTGTFNSSDVITGGTSGATYTLDQGLHSAGIGFTCQAPISNVVVNNNQFIAHSTAFKTSANASGASTIDIRNQSFCNNIVDGAVSRGGGGSTAVWFNHVDTDWSLRDFYNLQVCDNIFYDAASSLLFVQTSIAPDMHNFRISGNIVDQASSVHVNLNGNTIDGYIFEEVTNDTVSSFNDVKVENGEWDGPHMIVGDGANAFHVWQDGTNLRGLKGAPTASGDGTIIV